VDELIESLYLIFQLIIPTELYNLHSIAYSGLNTWKTERNWKTANPILLSTGGNIDTSQCSHNENIRSKTSFVTVLV